MALEVNRDPEEGEDPLEDKPVIDVYDVVIEVEEEEIDFDDED